MPPPRRVVFGVRTWVKTTSLPPSTQLRGRALSLAASASRQRPSYPARTSIRPSLPTDPSRIKLWPTMRRIGVTASTTPEKVLTGASCHYVTYPTLKRACTVEKLPNPRSRTFSLPIIEAIPTPRTLSPVFTKRAYRIVSATSVTLVGPFCPDQSRNTATKLSNLEALRNRLPLQHTAHLLRKDHLDFEIRKPILQACTEHNLPSFARPGIRTVWA